MPGLESRTSIIFPEDMQVSVFFDMMAQNIMRQNAQLVISGDTSTHSFRTLHFQDNRSLDYSYIYNAVPTRRPANISGVFMTRPLQGVNRYYAPSVNSRHYTMRNAEIVKRAETKYDLPGETITLPNNYPNDVTQEESKQVELLLVDFTNLLNTRLYTPKLPVRNHMARFVTIPN